MSDDLQKKYEEAMEAQQTLEFFVRQMDWKKQKTEQDVYQQAFCAGLLALSKQNEILLEIAKTYQRYIREIYRLLSEGVK